MNSDAAVAWLLADAADPLLTGDERTMVFVELGCGEHHLAIERILKRVVKNGFPLPSVLLATLKKWLDFYVGNPEERALRPLVAEIRPLNPTTP